MKNKHFFNIKAAKTAAFLTAAVIMLTIILTAGILPGKTYADEIDPLDFSKEGDNLTRSMDTAEIFRAIKGSELSDTEKAYLEASGTGYTLTYSFAIPSDCVSISVSGKDITVSAAEYSYKAANGVTVQWIPETVRWNDSSAKIKKTENGYAAVLRDADKGKEIDFTVTYGAKLTISDREFADRIVNGTFYTAKDARNSMRQYEKDLESYKSALSKYQKYEKKYETYLNEMAEYRSALNVYNTYSAALARYNRYLEDLETYKKDLEKYNNYITDINTFDQRLADYNAALAIYNEEMKDYDKYLLYRAEVDDALKCMNALESVFVKSSEGHQMYATLTGSTVSEVVAQKDKLVNVGGVSEEDIDNAGASTQKLISLLNSYKECKTEAAKLAWYQKNYTSLRDNFKLLYSSLYSLMGSRTVRVGLRDKGKYERYCQFVAHLYIISTGLDDSVIPTASWTIDKHPLNEVLEKEYIIEDINCANPKGVTLPPFMEEVPMPVLPMERPVYPQTVIYEPLLPEKVEKPKTIQEPQKPTAPDPVENPGEEPVKPQQSEELAALVSRFEKGKLTKRSLPEGDISVKVSSSLSVFMPPENQTEYPYYNFCNEDGSLIGHAFLKEGSFDRDITPEMPSDPRMQYTFEGWITSDGTKADWESLPSGTTVYPRWNREYIYHTVTWVLYSAKETETFTQTYIHGDLPECEKSPEIEAEPEYLYSFLGWNSEIVPVTEDVTYEALYEKTERTYAVKWVLGDEIYTVAEKYNSIPSCPVVPESGKILSSTRYSGFLGWDVQPSPVTSDITYTACFGEEYIVPVTEGKMSGQGLETDFSSEDGAFLVTVPESADAVDLFFLMRKASIEGSDIVLSLSNGAEIRIPSKISANMTEKNATILKIYTGKAGNSQQYSWNYTGIVCIDAGKAEIVPEGAVITVPFEETAGGDALGLGRNTPSENISDYTQVSVYTSSGTHTFVCQDSCCVFVLVPSFPVNLSSENPGIDSDLHRAIPGQAVTVSAVPPKGVLLTSVTVSSPDGLFSSFTVPASENTASFDMPAGSAAVLFNYEEQIFTVRFVVEGVTLSEKQYRYGETIVLPETPVKESSGGIAYTFSGWSPSVVSSVCADAVYEGHFNKTEEATSDKYAVSPYGSHVPVWFIILLIIAALAVCLIILNILKKKKVRKG